MNDNENTTTQNQWDTVKAVLRVRFIAISVYLKKQRKNQINNPTTPKATRKRRNEELHGQQKERNNKNQGRNKCKSNKGDHSKKINNAKSWFLEKINEINKPLARLNKKKMEKNQINKIRNENGDITTDNTEIQRIIRD